MDEETIAALMREVARGGVAAEEAVTRLRHLPFEAVDAAAKVDHHRPLRQGHPEFIYAAGKSPEQVADIMVCMAAAHNAALATRASLEAAEAVKARLPSAEYDPVSRVLSIGGPLPLSRQESLSLGVLCAGTSDLPVAEEAAQVAEFLGHPVSRLYDVGVAGLHRLLDQMPLLEASQALIVIAGMDGVLPSVVGGLVGVPVIAVPTSVGYGAAFGGIAPLLTMLNSCAAGLTVVNIDNGFGTALAAHRIGRLSRGARREGC